MYVGRIHLPFNKTLTDDTSVKWDINKTFLFFIRFMKLGEVVVPVFYNFSKFHQNQMKNEKVLLIAHLMDVSAGKVLLRPC